MNETPDKPTVRLRARWLILAGIMTGIGLGLAVARALPYDWWLWVALSAAVVTGVCVVFAIESDD